MVLRGHTGAVRCVGQAADGRLWSASDDGTVRLWAPSDARESATLRVGAAVLAVAQLTDGALVTGSVDGVLRTWPLPAAGPQCVTVPPTGSSQALRGQHAGGISALEVLSPFQVASAAHQRVATGGMDGVVCTWDLTAGQVLATYNGHSGAITSLTTLPSSGLLCSASMDRSIRLWGPGSTSEGVLQGHTHWINTVKALQTGQILTSGADRTLRWWEPDQFGAWSCVRVLPTERRVSTTAVGDSDVDAANAYLVVAPAVGSTEPVIYSPLHGDAPARDKDINVASIPPMPPKAASAPPVAAAAAGVAVVVAIALLLVSRRRPREQAEPPQQRRLGSARMQRIAERRARAAMTKAQ
jgi:WD40 repeat protein